MKLDLSIYDLKDILGLNTDYLKSNELSVEDILEIFKMCNAYWYHSGEKTAPHAELTSGMCSNGYFNCMKVLKYVKLSEVLAYKLALEIRRAIKEIKRTLEVKIDWIIGSPMAGITFAHDLARQIGAKQSGFVEKDPDNPGKMLWKRLTILPGETVLQVEELVTTAKTLNGVRQAIEEGNRFKEIEFLPVVGVLVHRPPKLPVEKYGDRKVVSLVEKEVWAVEPGDCPLCKGGSKPLRPKTHWDELIQTM